MEPSFSSGAAHADLDNDGDMDMVISNINHEAFVYENSLNDGKEQVTLITCRYKLAGDAQNRHGFGAWIEIFTRASSRRTSKRLTAVIYQRCS
jgi:hypothetical protein